MGRRFVEQLAATQEALGTALASGPGDDPREIGYAYQRGTVLVPAHAVPTALSALNDTTRGGDWAQPDGEEVHAGLRRITLGGARGLAAEGMPDPVGDDQDVLDALQLINTPLNNQYTAAPNHVISIANANMCPADEPVPTTAALSLSPVLPPSDGTAPMVLIVDTGLVGGVEPSPWVGGNKNSPVVDPDGYIREYVGHGTFIAELLTDVAPGASVWVSNLLPDLGAAFDDVFGARLVLALDRFEKTNGGWPDVISLSAGSEVMDLVQPLPGHDAFMTQLARHPDTLLVAAAGNNGDDRPFLPAAAAAVPGRPGGVENVISVGALRECGSDRACFSDFGPWVRVYAPGERLVAGFLNAPLKYQHSTFDHCQFIIPDPYDCTCQTPRHVGDLTEPHGHGDVVRFEGRAKWSGTSFATPLVAGMIARGMSRSPGRGAREVAEEILKQATQLTIEGAPASAVFPENYTGERPSV